MKQYEGDGSSSTRLTYQLADRLSDESSDVKNYIKKLEARIIDLESKRKDAREMIHLENEADSVKGNFFNGYDIGIIPKSNIVILVHGIRDRALWQSQVRSSLRAAGFKVALTNYGRFDIVRFLMPFSFFRRAVINKIRDQTRTIKLQHPNSDISIIAHSFGTYVISRVMNEEFDILFNKIIFCGGVFPQNIKFEQFSNRFSPPILNEIGAQDYWPAVANSVTWGYGAPGTFGFRQPLFEDRWHNHPGHSFFLTKEFSDSFWVPFINDGTIIEGESLPAPPHFMVNFISIYHIKYIILTILAAIVIFIYYLTRN